MTLVPSVNYIPSEHNSVKINPYECAVFTHDEKYHQSHDITDIVIVFPVFIGVFMTTSFSTNLCPRILHSLVQGWNVHISLLLNSSFVNDSSFYIFVIVNKCYLQVNPEDQVYHLLGKKSEGKRNFLGLIPDTFPLRDSHLSFCF